MDKISVKTTTRRKENNHAKEKAQETQTVLTVIPAGGSVVVSDLPDSLKVFRMTSPENLKIFEEDIKALVDRFVKMSGEDADAARVDLLDYAAYCNKPDVFFLVGIDKDWKCKAYLLAHAMLTRIFFIRQLVAAPGFEKAIQEKWGFIEDLAKQAGCYTIEGNTRRDVGPYSRWVNRFGMKKEYTVYRKVLINGQ